MDKYFNKVIKYAKKTLSLDKAHTVEMLLTTISGMTTITEVDLEFVNYCNLRCKWCSLDHMQKRSVMTGSLLRKFFDNLLFDRRFRSVKVINLFNGGEILLHPYLESMLNIIKEYKRSFIDKGLIFPKMDFLTNGTVLNAELSGKLVDLDVIDTIRFSVDGGSAEKYEELRKGAKWDVTSKNVRDFIKVNNGKIKTGIICIIESDKPKDTGWMSDEFKDLCSLVGHVELRYPHDWMGDVQVEGYEKVFKNYCKFLFHSLVLLPNGDVAVCCGDLNGKKGVIGNLNEKDMFRIYASRPRREMRYNLLRGRRDKIELCRNCSGYC